MKENRDILNMKEDFWNIIAKKLNNEELSTKEKTYLELMSNDKDAQRIIAEAENTLEKTDLFLNQKKYNTDVAWNKINSQINDKKKIRIDFKWVYRAAAVILILVTAGIATWKFSPTEKIIYAEVVTSENDYSCHEVVLPDGTTVKLNHNSKLIYPESFSKDTREVKLTGEAFFDVTPNKEKPFVIKTDNASVKVLGTSFNVYAYSNAPTVEVIVKTGKVELSDNVINNISNKKILLTPGQKGTFNKSTRTILKELEYNSNELSWISHEIKFEFTKLEDAFKTLQRIYSVQITVDEDVNLDNQLNATFNKQDLDYIMDVIALTLDLKAKKIEENKYIIQKN